MYHITLYGPGAYNGNFDYEIIKTSWPQPRQHGLLRTAFNLKDANGICMANHIVNRRIILRNICQCEVKIIMISCKVKRFPNTGQHAECKYIYFYKTQRFDVVLVPFNASSIFHTR